MTGLLTPALRDSHSFGRQPIPCGFRPVTPRQELDFWGRHEGPSDTDRSLKPDASTKNGLFSGPRGCGQRLAQILTGTPRV